MSEQRARMLDGELYWPTDPALVEDRRRCSLLLEQFNASTIDHPATRRALLQELLGSFGAGAEIRPPFYCDYGYPTQIGNGSYVNFGVVILDCAPVHIGANVQIGPGVQILTATHPLDAEQRRTGWESAHPIRVEDGAWLGGGAIVCPGVTIGRDTVIGAGSVVTKDIPAGVLGVGNPCQVIRQLSESQD